MAIPAMNPSCCFEPNWCEIPATCPSGLIVQITGATNDSGCDNCDTYNDTFFAPCTPHPSLPCGPAASPSGTMPGFIGGIGCFDDRNMIVYWGIQCNYNGSGAPKPHRLAVTVQEGGVPGGTPFLTGAFVDFKSFAELQGVDLEIAGTPVVNPPQPSIFCFFNASFDWVVTINATLTI